MIYYLLKLMKKHAISTLILKPSSEKYSTYLKPTSNIKHTYTDHKAWAGFVKRQGSNINSQT